MTDSIARAAADVAAAYLSHNQMPAEQVPEFCRRIADSLARGETTDQAQQAGMAPAIDPATSVQDDYIVCLEDGVKLKMLKRHLRVKFKLTPEQYRAKWGLPDTYPMVAPAYAKRRAAIARATGLIPADVRH